MYGNLLRFQLYLNHYRNFFSCHGFIPLLSCLRHSRESGNPYKANWILFFKGMT